MTTFAERLKTLTTPQLKKLETVLAHLDSDSNGDFDKLLARLNTPKAEFSHADGDLIGARTYELQINNGLDANLAHKQAREEFQSGKLARPKQSIPRRRLRTTAAPAGVATPKPKPPLPLGAKTEPATAANDPAAPIAVDAPLPDNIVVLPTKLNLDNFRSKFFHTPHDNNSVW